METALIPGEDLVDDQLVVAGDFPLSRAEIGGQVGGQRDLRLDLTCPLLGRGDQVVEHREREAGGQQAVERQRLDQRERAPTGRLDRGPFMVGGDPADGDEDGQQDAHGNGDRQDRGQGQHQKLQGHRCRQVLRERLLGDEQELVHQQQEAVDHDGQDRGPGQLPKNVPKDASFSEHHGRSVGAPVRGVKRLLATLKGRDSSRLQAI